MYRKPAFDFDQYREWLIELADSASTDTKNRFITISREYGCEGYAMASNLSKLIEKDHPGAPWLVFSHPVLERLVSDETLGVELIDAISGQRYGFMDWFIDGIAPEYLKSPQSKTFERLGGLILNLAEKGNCILLGGGSQIITQKLDASKFSAIHFRIIASNNFRVQKVIEMDRVSFDEANRLVKKNEFTRNRFVEDFTGISTSDLSLYHLIMNNEQNTPAEMAQIAYQYIKTKNFFS
jgi:hypothetical protein